MNVGNKPLLIALLFSTASFADAFTAPSTIRSRGGVHGSECAIRDEHSALSGSTNGLGAHERAPLSADGRHSELIYYKEAITELCPIDYDGPPSAECQEAVTSYVDYLSTTKKKKGKPDYSFMNSVASFLGGWNKTKAKPKRKTNARLVGEYAGPAGEYAGPAGQYARPTGQTRARPVGQNRARPAGQNRARRYY